MKQYTTQPEGKNEVVATTLDEIAKSASAAAGDEASRHGKNILPVQEKASSNPAHQLGLKVNLLMGEDGNEESLAACLRAIGKADPNLLVFLATAKPEPLQRIKWALGQN